MRFNQFDCGGLVSGLVICSANGSDLAILTGGGDTLPPPIATCADTSYDRVNLVSICDCVVQPFEHERTSTLSHHETISSAVEWDRVIGGKGANCTEFGISSGVHRPVRSSGNHHTHLPAVEEMAGIHDSRHCRGARCICRVVRAVQIEDICDSSRDDICQFARHCILIDPGGVPQYCGFEICKILIGDADFSRMPLIPVYEDPLGRPCTVLSSQCVCKYYARGFSWKFRHRIIPKISGVFQRGVRDAYRPLLACINLRKGSWGDPPLSPIELVALYPCSDFAVRFPFRDVLRSSLYPVISWSPPVFRHHADGGFARNDVIPEGNNIRGIRQYCTYAHDSDWLECPNVIGNVSHCHNHPLTSSGTMVELKPASTWIT